MATAAEEPHDLAGGLVLSLSEQTTSETKSNSNTQSVLKTRIVREKKTNVSYKPNQVQNLSFT